MPHDPSTVSRWQRVRMFLLKHPLIRLCLVNAGIGVVAALMVVAGLLAGDAHGLRRLMMAQSDGWIAGAVLTAGFVVTLGSVAIGAAIMMLSADDTKTPKGRLVPAPVRAAARPRRPTPRA